MPHPNPTPAGNDVVDELPETVAYTRYEIDCPECNGDPFDVEADPAGQVVECPEGHRVRVVETR